MGNKFKNEIYIQGYLINVDYENNSFQIKNGEDIIEFKYNDDFDKELLEDLNINDVILVNGSIDKDIDIFYLAKTILVYPKSSGKEF